MYFLVSITLCSLSGTVWSAIDSRIVGGENAVANEFPWQGSLQILRNGIYYHTCGCVLVSSTKVVTAAHCLSNDASEYRVVFGMISLSGDDQTKQYSNLTSYDNHPNWDETNTNGYPNDVAVMTLRTPINTDSDAVSTIQMADSNSPNFAGESCVISGWGKIDGSHNTIPDMLQRVNMTVQSKTMCSLQWILGGSINDGHICVSSSGKSSCAGDSGGPLVCGNVLAGVTSWGLANCGGTLPSVYTRISYFRNWIDGKLTASK